MVHEYDKGLSHESMKATTSSNETQSVTPRDLPLEANALLPPSAPRFGTVEGMQHAPARRSEVPLEEYTGLPGKDGNIRFASESIPRQSSLTSIGAQTLAEGKCKYWVSSHRRVQEEGRGLESEGNGIRDVVDQVRAIPSLVSVVCSFVSPHPRVSSWQVNIMMLSDPPQRRYEVLVWLHALA